MKIVPIVPEILEGGNSISPSLSKKQIVPAKKWCFTMNNYLDSSISSIFECLDIQDISIIGREVGENGTPHLQGFIEFKNKTRPMTKVKIQGIHWIKCKGDKASNIKYCSKDGDFECHNMKRPKCRSLNILKEEDLREFQKDIDYIFKNEPHERDLFWFYGNVNLGKTDIAKYVSHHYGVIPIGGESRHMLSQVFKAPVDCDFIIPLAYGDSMVSFSSIEKIKDGYLTYGS